MKKPDRIDLRDDPTWESVLELLARQGFLAKFYKIPRHEMAIMIRIYHRKAVDDLSKIFALTQRGELAARQNLADQMSEHERFVMLSFLVRSMKCWVETESFNPNVAVSPWKVANS